MTTLVPSFSIGSSSFSQVIRTCIKAWMALHFCQIQQLTIEYAALECLKHQCLHFFSVAIGLIFLNLQIRKKCIISWMYSNLARLDDRQKSNNPLSTQKIPHLGYNGENGVYNFYLLFTYWRTIQNILISCWLSGERPFPLGCLFNFAKKLFVFVVVKWCKPLLIFAIIDCREMNSANLA